WVRRVAEVIPTVWLNAFDSLISVDSCMPENAEGIYQGMKHLYDLGHRRIAFFCGSKLCLQTNERYQGYLKSLAALQLPVRDEYLSLYEEKWQENSEDMKAVLTIALEKLLSLPEPPTAIISPSDWDAALMQRTAQSMGVSVPGELSIIGFDNMSFCELLQPRLTSIHQPMEQMGEQACRLLLERINGIDRSTTALRLGLDLVLRDSTAKPSIKKQA
ncbi:MAG TPA: substrate-binding domain-containing protein, partial [Armatimonadota bacterium]|nr:substrate-binding domain-containing protein [Armatimonadota bacterium]